MADKAADGGFLAKELSLQAAVGLLLNSTTLFVVFVSHLSDAWTLRVFRTGYVGMNDCGDVYVQFQWIFFKRIGMSKCFVWGLRFCQ